MKKDEKPVVKKKIANWNFGFLIMREVDNKIKRQTLNGKNVKRK